MSETIAWHSSNSSIAAVDTSGRLRTLKAGEVKITATGAKSKVKNMVVVQIKQVSAQKIIIALPEKTQLAVGSQLTLTATVMPSEATEQKVKWLSSDAKIASVNQQGVINARKVGQVTITAKSSEQINDRIVLNVVPVQPLPSIQLYELNAQGAKGVPVAVNSLGNPLMLEPGKEKKFWVESIVKASEVQDYETKVKWICLQEDTATRF